MSALLIPFRALMTHESKLSWKFGTKLQVRFHWDICLCASVKCKNSPPVNRLLLCSCSPHRDGGKKRGCQAVRFMLEMPCGGEFPIGN